MFELVPRDHRNMSVFNPFREFEELERSFFNNDSLGEFRTDIREDGKNYILEADLPGFRKEDIKIDVDGERLVISAERKSETEEKDKKGGFVRRERCFGSFSRSFDLTGIKAEEIKAGFDNGVLKLTMPKAGTEKPHTRRLEIE